MSNPEGDALRTANSSSEGLQSQHEQLRYLFILTAASLVLVNLSVCVFMGKQWRTVKAQLDEQRPVVQKMWADYAKMSQPLVRNFVQKLQPYAAQNRDFQPILEKYHRPLADYFNPTIPAPAPAPPPAPGK